MPNHVTTKCVVTGPADDVARFRESTILKKTDEGGDEYTLLDFNAVILMPEVLRDSEASSAAEEGAVLIQLRGDRGGPFKNGGLYGVQINRIRSDVNMPEANISDVARAYLEKHPEIEKAGADRLKALLETGYTDWYSWSIRHWGTKWNSYSFSMTSDEPLSFTFDTAWNFPTPIFERLAAMYPALTFECVCFDEGSNFAGEGCFNPKQGQMQFAVCGATDALYERVYGHAPERDEDEAA